MLVPLHITVFIIIIITVRIRPTNLFTDCKDIVVKTPRTVMAVNRPIRSLTVLYVRCSDVVELYISMQPHGHVEMY